MGLHLTAKEEFLYNIVLYLKNGEDTGRNEPRNQEEIEKILNSKYQFKEIDIIYDELDYFGLVIDDFSWDNVGIWDIQQSQFKKHWVAYESEEELKEEFEDYMRNVLIPNGGSELENDKIEDDNELWELMGYEIRPMNEK